MEKTVELKYGDNTILYYREEDIWNEQYLLTMRESDDGKFISDDSIMELWQGTLGDISWVNPGMKQKYALEVYSRSDGYFTSIGPVIICDIDREDIESTVEALFGSVVSTISGGADGSKEYGEHFKKVLSETGFTDLVVGGGCRIAIEKQSKVNKN